MSIKVMIYGPVLGQATNVRLSLEKTSFNALNAWWIWSMSCYTIWASSSNSCCLVMVWLNFFKAVTMWSNMCFECGRNFDKNHAINDKISWESSSGNNDLAFYSPFFNGTSFPLSFSLGSFLQSFLHAYISIYYIPPHNCIF